MDKNSRTLLDQNQPEARNTLKFQDNMKFVKKSVENAVFVGTDFYRFTKEASTEVDKNSPTISRQRKTAK